MTNQTRYQKFKNKKCVIKTISNCVYKKGEIEKGKKKKGGKTYANC